MPLFERARRRPTWPARLWRPLLAALVLTLGAAEPAIGATSTGAGTATQTLQQLGQGSTVTLTSVTPVQTLTIPVPAGLHAEALAVHLAMSTNITSAVVSFSSAGRVLGLAHLDTSDYLAQPFLVPLTGATVKSGAIVLDVAAQLPVDNPHCQGPLQLPTVTLLDGSVVYGGAAKAPTTVAGFLPPILNTLRLWLPPDPTNAMVQAAAQVEAAVLARYGSQPVAVSIHFSSSLPDPGPFQAFDRDVVVGQPGQGVAVVPSASGAPLLVLRGSGSALALGASFVSSALTPLALSHSVEVGGDFLPHQIPSTEQTLTQLGLSQLSGTGVGTVIFTTPFSQAQFGGMVSQLTAHVSGQVSPTPTTSSVSVLLVLNGHLLTSQVLGDSTTFNLSAVAPSQALARDNTLDVEVQYQPQGGVCTANVLPLTAELSGGSSVEATLGPSLPLGFQRVPQALLPDFDLAVGSLTPSPVRAALQLVAALQRMTTAAIVPTVVPLDQVSGSSLPAVICTTDPGQVQELHPTVDLRGSGQITIDVGGRQLVVGTAPALAQVFTSGDRTLLVAESQGSDTHLDALSAALTAPPEGLTPFQHDVVVLQADGSLADVPVQSSLAPPASPAPVPVGWWVWVAVGAGVVIVVALVLALVRRRRHRGGPPTGAPDEAEVAGA
jgi:hypothetical protein